MFEKFTFYECWNEKNITRLLSQAIDLSVSNFNSNGFINLKLKGELHYSKASRTSEICDSVTTNAENPSIEESMVMHTKWYSNLFRSNFGEYSKMYFLMY